MTTIGMVSAIIFRGGVSMARLWLERFRGDMEFAFTLCGYVIDDNVSSFYEGKPFYRVRVGKIVTSTK